MTRKRLYRTTVATGNTVMNNEIGRGFNVRVLCGGRSDGASRSSRYTYLYLGISIYTNLYYDITMRGDGERGNVTPYTVR